MTALDKYSRIEAEGLWRQGPDSQHRNVIISIGNATLVITDMQDRPLTHWSLAAVARENPGKQPAVYYPDGDRHERLEIPESEKEMVEAIEKLRLVIDKRRPKPGRLRLLISLSVAILISAITIFWLPQAVKNYANRIVPDIKHKEIGLELLQLITEFTGKPCDSPFANNSLSILSEKTVGPSGTVYILPLGLDYTAHLPGNIILASRELVEDYEDPDVMAGFILAQKVRYDQSAIFKDMLNSVGTFATFRLLTTGKLPKDSLKSYSKSVLLQPSLNVKDSDIIKIFHNKNLRLTPYAYAVDVTGEKTYRLIEADSVANVEFLPVLSDGDWIQLQNICGG